MHNALLFISTAKINKKRESSKRYQVFIDQKTNNYPHSTERGTVVSILYGTYKFSVLPLSNFLDDFLLFEKITLIRCRGNGTEPPDFLNVLSREGIRQKLEELGSLVVGITYLLITFLIDEKVLQHLTEQDLFITKNEPNMFFSTYSLRCIKFGSSYGTQALLLQAGQPGIPRCSCHQADRCPVQFACTVPYGSGLSYIRHLVSL